MVHRTDSWNSASPYGGAVKKCDIGMAVTVTQEAIEHTIEKYLAITETQGTRNQRRISLCTQSRVQRRLTMEYDTAVKHTDTANGNMGSQIKTLSTTTRVEDAHASQNNGVVTSHLPDPRNLCDGFAVEPAHGTWDRMKDHIHTIICAGDEKLFLYVMRWLAAMIQKPDSAGQVALVLSGSGDTGKVVFIRCLSDLMGQHACHITDLKQVTRRSNGYLRDCVLLVIEGAFRVENNRDECVLKTLISESNIAIDQKGKDVQFLPNNLHVILTGNDDRVLDVSVQRRLCMLNVSNARKHDHAYFAGIAQEMANGGLSAMREELQHFDLAGFDVRAVPSAQR